jgi:hypothetical protein
MYKILWIIKLNIQINGKKMCFVYVGITSVCGACSGYVLDISVMGTF